MTATAWPPRQYDDGIPGDPAPWMEDAPCRRDPELFFSEAPTQIRIAKQICRNRCPAASECDTYARKQGIEYGVWGGVGRDERVRKQCTACEEVKPLRDFVVDSSAADGRASWCAPCVRAAAVEARRREREERIAGREAREAWEAQLRLERARAELNKSPVKLRAERDARVEEYSRLLNECGMGRSEAMRILGITERTAQRYEARLREQQTEVAA